MELGNMIFGNSRGEIETPTFVSCGLDAIFFFHPECDYGHKEYETNEFIIFPYYWGDCDCGSDELCLKWEEEHEHKKECYQSELKKIKEDMNISYTIGNKLYDSRCKALCERFGKPYPYGSETHCSCGMEDERRRFCSDNDHKEFCLSIKPNFKHKESGFSVKWYKHPGRDSYCDKITETEMRRIVVDCIKEKAREYAKAK